LVLPAVCLVFASAPPGCEPVSGSGDAADAGSGSAVPGDGEIAVIGEPGRGPGQFAYPRPLAVGPDDGLFVLDKTGRMQRFDPSGRLIGGWVMPYVTDPTKRREEQRLDSRPQGFPVGLTVRGDRVYIPDTHYFRVLTYTLDGQPLGEFGSFGTGPGQFTYPTSVAFGPDGRLYVAEYGGNDRVQVFTPEGRFLFSFGTPGAGPGQFSRPQAMAFDRAGRLWIADACNHRLCVYTAEGKLLRTVGGSAGAGSGDGEFNFPYGLAFDRSGNLLVSEFGNHRLQKLDPEGRPLGVWGGLGRGLGELKAPWSVAVDSRGLVSVVDSGNNRVVRFRWP
jgi:DNA-binding beta-propeller fold protein YncE